MRAPVLVLAGLAAILVAVSGCSTPQPARTPAPTASVSPETATPTPTPVPPTRRELAAERVASMTLEQRAASVLMVHPAGTDPAAAARYAALGVGGYLLLGDDVAGDPASLAAYVDAIDGDPGFPALVGVDEEGGTVQRLPWDPSPGAAALRDADPSATRDAFAARAAVLAAAGISVNFGIVADTTADPDSFIAPRVLGTDPAAAAARVAAAVDGEHGTVLSTLKHFPGHGAAPGDSHSSVPTADLDLEAWRSSAAAPFAAGVDAGAELVMTGHLVYTGVDAEPATFSATWHRVLREELGFDGVVVTDDLLMLQRSGVPEYADPYANAVRALAAGGDLLLLALPADPSTVGVDPAALVSSIAAAVREGRLPQARLDDAASRVAELRMLVAERRGALVPAG